MILEHENYMGRKQPDKTLIHVRRLVEEGTPANTEAGREKKGEVIRDKGTIAKSLKNNTKRKDELLDNTHLIIQELPRVFNRQQTS